MSKIRISLIAAFTIAALSPAASAQNVTVIGPITPGNIPQFNSTTIIKDSGVAASSLPTGLASPSGAVGLSAVPGSATTALRSDAAPPLAAAVQSALTGTNNGVALGTGAFGFGTTAVGTNNQALMGNTGAAPAFRQPAFTDLSGTIATTQITALPAAVFANPSAFIGLTAVNGVATTAMRSDATPALSQSITPTWTGLHTFNPAGASDALDIIENLNGAAHFGLSIAQTVTGAMGAGFNHNLINITSDNSQCTGAVFCNGFTSQYSIGGAAMTGGRQAIQASVTMTAASSPSNTNRNYVAGTFIGIAQSSDNGTNTGAGALGAMFGLNSVASLNAGATNWLNISGGETDFGMDSTASTKYMLGWTVASGYNGTSNGSGTAASMGAGFNVSGITAQTLDAGYILSDINSAWPIRTTGTLQRAFIVGATPTVTNGTDWSAVTFSGSANSRRDPIPAT